ncbi:MAG: signal peptidase II [Gammaproteobacteria bacterium]|nr:signal peptidase II [Gammaproteobacteria bacterium]
MRLYLAIAIEVVFADQITKWFAQQFLVLGESYPITRFLNWYLVYNPGAAFSFLADAAGWQRWFFIIFGIVAAVVIVWIIKKNQSDRLLCWSLALILGGAIGNVIDRLHFGAVLDFIDVHYAGWHWPAFNLADSAITLGALLIIWGEINRLMKKPSAPS